MIILRLLLFVLLQHHEMLLLISQALPMLSSDCADPQLDGVKNERPCLSPIRADSLLGQPFVQPLSYEPITNTTNIDKKCGNSSDYSVHIDLCFFHEKLPVTLTVTRNWVGLFDYMATWAWNSDSPEPNTVVINLDGAINSTADRPCHCTDEFTGILHNGIMYGNLDYRKKNYSIRKAGSAFTEEQKKEMGVEFHSFIVGEM